LELRQRHATEVDLVEDRVDFHFVPPFRELALHLAAMPLSIRLNFRDYPAYEATVQAIFVNRNLRQNP
jgi:hypothetical protein